MDRKAAECSPSGNRTNNGRNGVTFEHVVIVLDDDQTMLKALERLLTAQELQVRTFEKAEDFFKWELPEVPSCLLLDHHLGDGMTGVQVHAELQRRGWDIPTVFLTAHWNVQSVVRAMRAGADGFLTKPYDPDELVATVRDSLVRAQENRSNGKQAAEAKAKAATLTQREREIVRLVVSGLLNKEIADKLGLALVTVKVHRGRVMHKLGAGNPAELVYIAGLGGLLD
jgi:FixJ family two-component response regulator